MLGEPDVGLLYPPEMARRTNQIAAAAPGVNMLVDADTGGGSVLNIQRTVRSLIKAGAKGCVIEDQVRMSPYPLHPGTRALSCAQDTKAPPSECRRRCGPSVPGTCTAST